MGLVPLEAMLSAGRFYIDDDSIVDEKMLVQKAISGLMLDKLDDFEPESSIIEWAIKRWFDERGLHGCSKVYSQFRTNAGGARSQRSPWLTHTHCR